MNSKELIKNIDNGIYNERILDVYVDDLDYHKSRLKDAINAFEKSFGVSDISIYSAPGRTEVGGNHTDHQHGQVLAASINKDTICVTQKTDDDKIVIAHDSGLIVEVDLSDIAYKKEEECSTISLVKGVVAGFVNRGYKVGGFKGYITSDVLVGAGISSSAAYENTIGTVLSNIYNDNKVSAVEIAIISQYAENTYFGKPCGLMDQMASSVGSLVYIDFYDPKNPVIEKVEFDMAKKGYSLCITDTKGSHSDLTEDYALVPQEMKNVAKLLGHDVLVDVSYEDLVANMAAIREVLGDRALLRALHFINENKRVPQEVEALKNDDLDTFLKLITASGNSSYKYLQNVYTNHDIKHQNVSIALCVSEMVLGANGVSRVHGGGFAGTIQAFVKNEFVDEYKNALDNVFGNGSCCVYKIRKYGGIKLI